MSDIVEQCHRRWECRAMEIELAQASSKLVEMTNTITALRTEIERFKSGFREAIKILEQIGDPAAVDEVSRIYSVRVAPKQGQTTHEYVADYYRPSRCLNCGMRRDHAVHKESALEDRT